ncbi:DMT family transporter [Marinicella sp. S1101]|uniref:DMT family transporter n=1 Tax=Marinicella marina TaxID=2996016 RepID=UPI002260D8F5|nr:DMT family transporter [Marinicella marina]MCX7553053.1 DMT family transporter [Marinicella marina]MDJ1139587.1 DMT family transporter [Marinicella marina]
MLVAAVVISSSGVWVKLANLSASAIGFYRMLIGGVILLLICLLRGQPLIRSFSYTKWLVLGAVFFAADLWFWHQSIQYVGPGLATVLGNVQVFFMTLFGYLFLKEVIGFKFFLGLTFTFAGLFLLVGMEWDGFSAAYRLGVYYGLATALCYTGFMLCLRHTQSQANTLSPMANLGVLSIICAMVLAVVLKLEGGTFQVPDWQSWLSVILLGVFCQVIGWAMITKTMPLLPTSIVGLLLLLQPAMAMIWDVLFFSRPTGMMDVIGLVLVLSGIYLATLKRRTKRA